MSANILSGETTLSASIEVAFYKQKQMLVAIL